MNRKPLLAFDCAGAGASISLSAGGAIHHAELPQGRQAAELVSAIDRLLTEASVAYQDLAGIISTTGPGSFTGLRIGLATMHGLSLAHSTPIKLLTTLEAMAWRVHRLENPPSRITVAFHVGKGELATQSFDLTQPPPSAVSDISRVPESQSEWPHLCYGNHYPTDHAQYLNGTDTRLLLEISAHVPAATLADAMPLYIRPPDAAIPKPHHWLAS